SRADGWLAVRESHWDTRKPAVALRSPGGELHQAKVGRYDLFNHWFPVQGAPELWFLKGKPETKRLVTLDPVSGELTTRFPLEWDPGRGAQLFGGPALHLGDALVHAGTVYDGRGLLPGNAFVVRRALPDGRAEWVHTADRPVTALAGDGETVYAAFNSGELLALDARDGSVRWRHDLDPGVALSLHLPSPDRLVLGLVDGRILDCSV
ncbi:PQQ-binding-like beta-propeller repeat protein, partial [Crossiella equi]